MNTADGSGTARFVALALVLVLALGVGTQANARHRKHRKPVPLQLQYVQSSASVARGTTASALAECPAGTKVIGGGTFLSGPTGEGNINTSGPAPADDPAVKPDKGWIGYVRNTGLATHTLVVTAICANLTRVRYIRSSVPADENSVASTTAVCPAGTRVTGGGSILTGPATEARLTTSAPSPVGDPNITPDRGWNGVARTFLGAAPQNLVVIAICAGLPQLQYVQSSAAVPPNGDASAIAECPAATLVTGGGTYQSGAASDSSVNTSAPEPAGSPTITPDKGWIGFVRNNVTEFGPSTHTLIVTAICAAP